MNQLEKNDAELQPKNANCCPMPQRYVTGLVCSIAGLIELFRRNVLDFTFDNLVKPQNISIVEQKSQCPRGPGKLSYEHSIGPYEWTAEMQKYILLSFYIGYLMTQLPVGMISERFGVKWPFLSIILASSLISATTPIVTKQYEEWGLCAMNLLLGAAQGGLIPTLAAVAVRWYPIEERCRSCTFLLGCSSLGHALAHIMTQCVFNNYHWSVIFYFSAGLGFVWSVVFASFCYSTPDDNPHISTEEKLYLDSNINNVSPLSELAPVPWKLMLTSLPVWAYIAVTFGHDWVIYNMYLGMPMYMYEVLRLSHTAVIIWTVIPIFLYWIITIVWGFFSDYVLNRELMDTNDLRKMNTMIASFGPGIFLLFCVYAGCRSALVILFFTFSMCLGGQYFSGAKLSAFDLCPNYAGSLMGITNGLGCLGALVPSFINFITSKSTLIEWRNVFWIDFVVVSSTGTIYLLFGSAEEQYWNKPNSTRSSRASAERRLS